MMRIYNRLLNTTSVQNSTYILNDTDVILYEEFKGIINEQTDYSNARIQMISKITDNSKISQEELNEFITLKTTYFESDKQIDIIELNDSLQNIEFSKPQPILDIQTISIHIKNYLCDILKTMNECEYQTLLDLSLKFKELVLFTLQPLFISVMSLHEYVKHMPYFITNDNFYKLLIYCKNKPQIPSLNMLNDIVSVMPFKTIFAISSTIIITPLLCYGFYTYYDSQPLIVKPLNSFNIPKMKRPGFQSEYLNLLRELIFNVSCEFGSIMSQIPAGMTAGGLFVTQERIEENICDSGTTISLDRNNNTIEISSSKTEI